MGWSCTKAAGDVATKWTAACIESTGSQNVWLASDGARYMWEETRKEHADGAITGRVWRFVDEHHVRPCGSFRIDGDGTIKRAPAWLKAAAQRLTLEAAQRIRFEARPRN